MFLRKNNYKQLVNITKKLHEFAPALATNIVDQFYKRRVDQSIYIEELNCIYIPVPKVATKSFQKIFADYYCNIHSDQRFNLKTNKKWGLPFHTVSENQIDQLSDEVFIFSFVRNPYERVLSCFLDKIKTPSNYLGFLRYGNRFHKEMGFEDFLSEIMNIPDEEADKHFRPQHCFLKNGDDLRPHFVGKLEHFSRDFQKVLDKIGTDQLEIAHANKSNSKKEARNQYFTPKAKELIRERYKEDFLYFEYPEQLDKQTNG